MKECNQIRIIKYLMDLKNDISNEFDMAIKIQLDGIENDTNFLVKKEIEILEKRLNRSINEKFEMIKDLIIKIDNK